MEQPVINPYAFYFSGVVVVLLVILFELRKEYREEGYIDMPYGRAARLFFAIVFSWFSCVAPLTALFVCGILGLADANFWKKKIKTKRFFR